MLAEFKHSSSSRKYHVNEWSTEHQGRRIELSSNSDDDVASMISGGSTDHYKYNLTVKASSRVILNAGTGFFNWRKGNTTQWSFPSGQTSGTLSIGDSLYQVNEERSMTWYD